VIALLTALVGAPVTSGAASVSLLAEDSLTRPPDSASPGNVLENATQLSFPWPVDSDFLPLTSESLSDDGGHARAESEALAHYGRLEARAGQWIDDGSVTGYRQSRAHVAVAYVDEVTITRPAGPGPGSLRAIFDLEGAAFATWTAGAPAATSASYRVTVRVAETVLEWVGDFADGSGSGASELREATIMVGGVTVPDTLPDALPGAGFTTPAVAFDYGVTFPLSVRVEVTAEGLDEDAASLASEADLAGSFRWLGLADLPDDALVSSASGRDWTMPAPGSGAGCTAGGSTLAALVALGVAVAGAAGRGG
jgi:hypothetical protein